MCDHNIDPSGDAILTLENPNNVPAALSEPVAVETPAPPGGGDSTDNSMDKSATVTFLVSSRHLVLASPVFKAMLKGGWSEGNKKGGRFRIRAEDWDVEALTVVMNVLHSHYRQVSKTVTLKMLAKIGMIVDYYKVHEAFQPMARLWMGPLKDMMPDSSFPADAILWLSVSWVFEYEIAFTKITKVAILWSQKSVEVPRGLPIPQVIIDRVNERRKESLDAIAAGLRGLQEDYTEGREGCSYECSAIRLGALMKSLHKLKLVGHPPEAPFGYASVMDVTSQITTMKTPTWYDSMSSSVDATRRSVNDVTSQITTMKTPAWYDSMSPSVGATRRSGYHSSPQAHQCAKPKGGGPTTATLAKFAERLGNRVKGEIKGLQIADFTSNAEKQ